MAPLTVDPEALYAAGSAVAATGDALAASLSILTAGFSAHTGVDRAGEIFGLTYQEKAESVLKAAAAAVNACRRSGAVIQQGASNYSNVDAASTLGGGRGALKPPSPSAELAAPGPPGTWGPGQPPPPLWSLVQSFVLEVWPDGDVAGLRAAASCWRAFGAAANGVKGTLDGSKTLFDGQHIPEREMIDNALTDIGSSAATIGGLCGALAETVDTFANKVDHAQTAIRDLLRRIESLGDLGHDVMLIVDGDAWDEIKQIVKDINAVLQHLGQEARACEDAIKFVVQAADRLVTTCEKYARRGLVRFLGDDVGNAVATVADTWINAHEGVLKGAVGMGLGLVDLSPHWIAADPQGAARTWTGLVKNAWKESLINAAVNPHEFAEARLQELKGLAHADDWSRARPGLGAGEVALDAATLIAPVLGEAGAAADGAGAAARGAEEETQAAGEAAGRAGGEGTAGARGALTDITKAGGDVTKNLERAAGDLPEIKPPTGGTPVGLPSGKPLEAPVEATPRPAEDAPALPDVRTAAPEPRAGLHEPAPGPAKGWSHDPATAPPAAPASMGVVPHEPPPSAEAPAALGPHQPMSVHVETSHAPGPVRGPHEPAPLSGPHEPAAPVIPHDPALASMERPPTPASVTAAAPHEPPSGIGPREPALLPMEPAHEPVSGPAAGTPADSAGPAMGEKALSTNPQRAEHAPPLGPEPSSRSPVEPVPIAVQPPQAGAAVKSAARGPQAGPESELPVSAGGPRGAGEGGPAGRPRPPLDDSSHGRGDGGPPSVQHPNSAADGFPGNLGDHLGPDDLGAFADYTGPGYHDLNNALRSGLMDASQQARVQALQNALAKLPPYRGPVIRGTNLPPEVLARYRPGEVVTEHAFLSTSTHTGVARSPTFGGNVEFRILSKTGRDISSFSVLPGEHEVLFPAGTKFYVVSKIFDALTGRTVIRMVER